MSDFPSAAQRIVDDYLRHEPIEATLAGVHDHDSELPDLTLDGFAADQLRTKAYLATLERFIDTDLSVAERIDRDILAAHFETEVREYAELQPHRHDPSLYPGIAVHGVYSLLIRDFAPIEKRVPALRARLDGVTALLDAGRTNLIKSPAVWNAIAAEETQGGIDFLLSDVAPLADRFSELRKPLESALAAFGDYADFLTRVHAARDGMPFAVGRELFDFILRREHMLLHDANSLLAFGEEAVRTTIDALQSVAAVIDKGKTWTEILDALRTDHPSQSELLAEYRKGVDAARDFVIEKQLVTMPAGELLDVVETPPFLRPTVPYAAYMPPGPFEQRQRGLYYVTPVSDDLTAEERAEAMLGHNRYGMLLTNVHEAYPGHHLQLVKANQQLPSPVRKLFENTVLVEGWALYCEQLVLDEGITTDPRVRLFQLKDQLWRACRVVIDVKLHTGAMTFDEAVDMLVNVAHLERPNAIGEVRRYTQSPTQPMSYLMGKHQLMQLRERERNRLGAAFDLCAFHDSVLSQGSIPVALIEQALSA